MSPPPWGWGVGGAVDILFLVVSRWRRRRRRRSHLSVLYLLIEWTDWEGENADYILLTLTPFSKSQEGLDCWEMGRSLLSALYLLIDRTYISKTYINISLGEGKC